MKTSRVLRIGVLLIGFAIYVISFFPFLPAVKDNAGDATFAGWKCALLTLQAPLGHSAGEMFHENPLGYFAVLFSGWINPFFLIAMVASLVRPVGKFAATMRIITIVMFPAGWIAFHELHVRPSAGYFLWTGGMLLVLFSSMFSKGSRELSAGPERIG